MEKKNTIVVLVFIFAFLFGRQLFAIDQKSTSETAANVTINMVSGGTTPYSIVYGAAGGTVVKIMLQLVQPPINRQRAVRLRPNGCQHTGNVRNYPCTKQYASGVCFHEFYVGRIWLSYCHFWSKTDNNGNGQIQYGSGTQTFLEVGILKSTLLAGSGFLKFSTTNDQY